MSVSIAVFANVKEMKDGIKLEALCIYAQFCRILGLGHCLKSLVGYPLAKFA